MSEQVKRVIRQRLESLQRAGVRQLPATALRATPCSSSSLTNAETVHAAAEMDREEEQPLLHSGGNGPVHETSRLFDGMDTSPDQRSAAATLEALQEEVAACTRCADLAYTRTHTVFGVGNPRARLCFLGEAPGAEEDRQGEPFVGRAGQLLNRIIEACGMKREEVYILNVIKCRPPNNRNPLPQEAANCRRFLDRQLELIRPEFICCLGAVAAQNLLQTTASIGRLRGQVHRYGPIKVVCTYHPAYLLRNPAAKKPTWEDMQLLMAEMGLEVPTRG